MKFQILNIIKILSGFLNDVSTFLREPIHNIIKEPSVNKSLFDEYFEKKKKNIIKFINSRGVVLGNGFEEEVNTNSSVSFELSDLKKGIHYITLSFIRDEKFFNENITSSIDDDNDDGDDDGDVIINIYNKNNGKLFSDSFGVENKVLLTKYKFLKEEMIDRGFSERSWSDWWSHSKSETISYTTEALDEKSNDFKHLEGLLNVTVSDNSIDEYSKNNLLNISHTFRSKRSVKECFKSQGIGYFGCFKPYYILSGDEEENEYGYPTQEVLNQRLKIRNGGKESSSVEKKVIKIKLTKDCGKLIVKIDFKKGFYKKVFLHNVFIPRKNVK